MKIKSIRNKFLTAAFVLALGGVQAASAAIITTTLGNDAPGFNDGDKPDIFAILGAQAGQPVPFNQGCGSDVVLFDNCNAAWAFGYAPIAETILSATLKLGIADHDSAASGDQVALFSIDGTDLTSDLNTQFNGSGGSNSEYNVYELNLSSLLASLSDGSALVVLNLTGPGLQECLIFLPGCDPANPVSETGFNGASLIFSTLTIETRDPGQVPEPASILLFGLGALGIGFCRRKRVG